MMTEENVVSKVAELMEALDNIKRYNAFACTLRRFAIILGSSIAAYLIVRAFLISSTIDFSSGLTVTRDFTFYAAFASLIIPMIGFLVGYFFVRRKLNSVKTGEWKEELSQGFPAALKILMELDWDKTFDEISMGKLGYGLYGALKTVGIWFILTFVIERLGNLVSRLLSFPIAVSLFGDLFSSLLALVIVFLIVGNDLFRRYREIHALDMLLWELRELSVELRRSEFQA